MMNLNENISRVKKLMGLVVEQDQQKNEVINQLNWLRSYVMSPKYMERLKKEFPDKDQSFIENERNQRYKNLENIEYRTHFVKSIGLEPGFISGLMIPKKYKGYVWDNKTNSWIKSGPQEDPKGYDKPGHVYFEKEYDPKSWSPSSGFETIPTHEYGHAIDDAGYRIPKGTEEKIKKKTQNADFLNYKSDGIEFDYKTTPSEFINRIQSIRYLLDKQNIYDAKTQEFKDSHFEKMIKNPVIKNNVHYKEVFDALKGSDSEKKKNFIDIMNTIAYNETKANQNMV